MEKKIYCLIEGRCKSIKFTAEHNLSDIEIVQRKIKEAAKSDKILNIMLQGKMMVLQRPDPDRNNKLCDLEEEDEIEDKSEITVLLIPLRKNAIESLDSVTSVDGESIVKILYTESLDNDNNSFNEIDVQQSACLNIKEDKQDQNLEAKFDNIQVDYATNSKSKSEIEDTEIVQLTRPRVTGPGSICHPTILPPITPDLQKKLDDIGLLRAQKNFIAFWAAHLSYVTNQWPTKSDYQNFAQSIVAAYPALGDIGGGCTLIKNQLSVWIRNHRALEKRQSKKRRNEEQINVAIIQAEENDQKEIDQPTDYVTNKDVENALKELEKKFVGHKNISHMKKLLKVTITYRRPWINEAKRIVDIVQKYPQLNNYELIISEFLELQKMSEEVLFDQIEKMMSKLTKYYFIKKTTNNKIFIMQNLYADLTKKNKNFPALFIIEEVMGDIDNLMTNEGDAPRIVMYTDGQDIVTAYLVADAEIKIQIPQPTMERIIAGLFTSYYVWNRQYPTAYKNILNFISYEVLKTPIPITCTTIRKFIRSCDNTIKDFVAENS